MQVSAWSNGSNAYGIHIGKSNRDKYFNSSWKMIEVEVDSQLYQFQLTGGFWRKCPEFRDKDKPVIREWLSHHKSLVWPFRQPPKAELIPWGQAKFRLVP